MNYNPSQNRKTTTNADIALTKTDRGQSHGSSNATIASMLNLCAPALKTSILSYCCVDHDDVGGGRGGGGSSSSDDNTTNLGKR